MPDPPKPVSTPPKLPPVPLEGPITRAEVERLFEQLRRLEALVSAIESMLRRGGM
jgi:hypothetical protein